MVLLRQISLLNRYLDVKVFPGHVSVSLVAAFLKAPAWHFRFWVGLKRILEIL